jgi:hypothetical protein
MNYGAVADGVTNNNAVINAAIADIASKGGGILYFPPGAYVIEGPTPILMRDKVSLVGAGPRASRLAFTGSWSDAMIQSVSRNDNNPSVYERVSIRHLSMEIFHTSPVPLLDCTGFRNGYFVDLFLNGGGVTAGQTAIRTADTNPAGTSHKSCFFNEFSSIEGSGAGWGTWIDGTNTYNDTGNNIFINHNVYSKVGIDTANTSNVFIRGYYAGAQGQPGVPAGSTYFIKNTGNNCVFLNMDYEGYEITPSFKTDFSFYGTTSGITAWLKGLQIPGGGYLDLGGYSPIGANDLAGAFVLDGLSVSAETSTSVRVDAGTGFNKFRYSTTFQIVLSHTNTGSSHTEYVYVNNDPNQEVSARIFIKTTAPTANDLVLAECDVNASGVRTALRDVRRRFPAMPILSSVSADRGDTDVTLTAGRDAPIQRFATTLTGNRVVTLSGGSMGQQFRIVRTGLGSFTLDVGGLKTIASATAAFVDVTHDGTAWRLTGYGAL